MNIHELITVTTFALTIYHSLSLSLQTQNRSHSQILSSIVFLAPFGQPSQILDLDCTQRGTGICFSFFFLYIYFFCFWSRVLD